MGFSVQKQKMENLPKAVGLIDIGGDARRLFIDAFVKLKRRMAAQPDRGPLKISRDHLQADLVEQLVTEYLPQLVQGQH